MGCGCKKQIQGTATEVPKVPDELKEHFIQELDEYKSPISEPVIDEVINQIPPYPLIED